MSSPNDLEASREAFWATKAADRQRRSSSRSYASQDGQQIHPEWIRPRDDTRTNQQMLAPLHHFGQPVYGHDSRPRAMSNTSGPYQTNDLGIPLRPYTSQQGDGRSLGHRRTASTSSPRYDGIEVNNAFPGYQRPQIAPSRSHTRRDSSSSPIVTRAPYDPSRPHRRGSSVSSTSRWDDKSLNRHHRSRSSVSHSTRTFDEAEENLRRMHPTRAYIHDKKDQYIHEKPMKYPQSTKRATQVAAGGVAGALGAAGAVEASRHTSCFGFEDIFDCGFCECFGL